MPRLLRVLLLIGILGFGCFAQAPKDAGTGNGSGSTRDHVSANDPLPRSDQQDPNGTGESSSRNTKIDLSPPPGEAPAPGVGDVGEVQEMKPWDPHKADKNNEVGDYYYRLKNYKAAESRYSEALYWQDNNAHAMFGIAQVEEKLGRYAEARRDYQKYLKILPDGEFAARAHQGLERLKDKPDQPLQSAKQKPAGK